MGNWIVSHINWTTNNDVTNSSNVLTLLLERQQMIFSAYTLYRYHAVQICQLVNHRVLLFVFPYLRLLGEAIGTGRHRNSNSCYTVMSAG